MLIGFISDIHGNSIAFELLLQELKKEKVEKIYFLGDAVGYFPDGNQVINGLDEQKIDCLLGNHDAMVLGHLEINLTKDPVYLNQQQKQELSQESNQIMMRWVPFKLETIDSYRVLLIHGSPFNPLEGYIYPDTSPDIFDGLNFDVMIMGHTHRPFVIKNNDKFIINTGSIGLPRDFGNSGSYILWDTTSNDFTIKRFILPVRQIIDTYKNIHEKVKFVLNRNNI